ncbi:LacI family DNA-binding transcriptional regulator, partial [Escherichia coli]|uniref:LacI family DNA-binding transcriptional regulator n=1 Tax=Escherichia coli TaxID=562 RepID=UPI00321941A9
RVERERPTVRDVAQLAGVSIGTVSRVVNGIPNVSPAVRGRVQQAIDKLGWKPSMVAQNMRGQASRMIGFIFSDLENPLYASMIKG